MKPIRIVFLGAERVGKTSTIKQFLYESFENETEVTLGQSYIETVHLPNGMFQQVQIIDTNGSDEFPAMRDVNIKNGDYFVVMYAVDNRQSFDMAFTLCQQIRDIKGKDFDKIIIVGNKIDLKHSRQVTTEDVLRKSMNDKMCWFTEISAKLNCNIRCLFQIILKNYVKTNDLFLGKKTKRVSNLKSNKPKCTRRKTRKISVQILVCSLYTEQDKLHDTTIKTVQ